MASDSNFHHKQKYIPDGAEHSFCRNPMQTLSCHSRPWTSNQVKIAVRASLTSLPALWSPLGQALRSWCFVWMASISRVNAGFKMWASATAISSVSQKQKGRWDSQEEESEGHALVAFKEDAPWNVPTHIIGQKLHTHTQLWAHLGFLGPLTWEEWENR